jgi:KTSC domain
MKYTQDTPNSSAVTSYTYDSDTLDLEVKFKSGASYRFLNVSWDDFDKLKSSPSVGGFIAANSKNYEFERLEAPKKVPNPPWVFPTNSAPVESPKQIPNPPTDLSPWPFPTGNKPKEEVYTEIVGWSPEEEEEFMRMIEKGQP